MTERISPRHILVTGGVRSGKSKFAEDLAGRLGGKVIYLATAEALDDEMRQRIEKHRRYRPHDWTTIEEPVQVPEVLSKYQKGTTVLLDCLTLYLSNLFFKYEHLDADGREQAVNDRITALAATVKRSDANIIIVTNEVGWGVVPDNELGRRFRDLAGSANQTIAAVCEEVYLMVSGIPVRIKGGKDA